jgi:serine/threonine-protein kinase RsbW
MNESVPAVEIEVPARAEFVRLVRLVVAGVGNVARLDLEEIEDLKLAVGEACYAAFFGVQSPDAQVRISARVLPEGVELLVSRDQPDPEGPAAFSSASGPCALGLALVEQVVDEVSLCLEEGGRRLRILKLRRAPADS